MNIDTLANDMRELIEYLNLDNITVVGHSMGAGTIFRYVNKFGCDRIKNIVAVDMRPYMRNTVWKGGINQGNWSDEDFFCDLDRYFDNVGLGNWYIVQNAMVPAMKTVPKNLDNTFISAYSNGANVFTAVSLWWSLFRTDSREAIKKITVPFLYMTPETPLYSIVTVNFYRENVKNKFVLENNFPNTTHMILMEQPKMVADAIKKFLNS